MSWNVIRKATNEDYDRLRATACRFAKRHNIPDFSEQGQDIVTEVSLECEYQATSARIPDNGYLRKLWLRCVRRALNDPHAEGIAWGTVGYHVDF